MPNRRSASAGSTQHGDATGHSLHTFLLIACGLSVGILCGFVVGVAFEVSREVQVSAASPDPFLPSLASAGVPSSFVLQRSRELATLEQASSGSHDTRADAAPPAPPQAQAAAQAGGASSQLSDAIAIARGRRPGTPKAGGIRGGSKLPAVCRAVSRTVDAAHDRAAEWRYWPASTSSAAECFWTRLEQIGTRVGHDVCTHNPREDLAVSAAMHQYHNFAAYADIVMWSSRATCDAFAARNFILDVGAGFGLATSIFASSGCNVIAMEAADENVALGMQTLQRLSPTAASRVSWLRNAPYPHAAKLYSVFAQDNAYASFVSTREMPEKSTRPVAGLPLSSLFTWANRPVNPRTQAGVTADDVLFVKLDVQGLNMLALDDLRNVLTASRIPYISLVLRREGVDGGACSSTPLVQLMYSLGYMGFEGPAYTGHSLAWWVSQDMDAPTDKSWFVTFVHAAVLPRSPDALVNPLSLDAEAADAYAALHRDADASA